MPLAVGRVLLSPSLQDLDCHVPYPDILTEAETGVRTVASAWLWFPDCSPFLVLANYVSSCQRGGTLVSLPCCSRPLPLRLSWCKNLGTDFNLSKKNVGKNLSFVSFTTHAMYLTEFKPVKKKRWQESFLGVWTSLYVIYHGAHVCRTQRKPDELCWFTLRYKQITATIFLLSVPL